ncbi:unnamed protein product [Clonostachys solani]|uniref:DUF8035 domain-containing protein n=1 Tax=Clonostachys solani TaxID=160281 RepID=A0A9N9W4M9_9HYPO|nr:unnamed protein product [Clonostachys solani]
MGRNNDFEEHDYYPSPRRSAPEFEEDFRRRVVTRSPPRERGVSFLREEARRPEAGPVVLRSREVETIDRHRRSPSPRYEEVLVRRPRSQSTHTHEHERTKSRTRYVEKERVRKVSPSPAPKPQMVRYVERRPRSPSPVQRDRIRIVDKRREASSSSSSSSSSEDAPPSKIRAPTIERDVITHYRGIDHGVVKAAPPSPIPPRRSFVRERETDIDISLSKNRTAVDVTTRDRNRSRSRERRSGKDELVVYKEKVRPRAHSAGPLHTPIDEEGEFLSSKIDSRGRMGEAWHGATKDWTIVDVPPGTERVRMDGVGGGATDTQWSKYSGVRRTQFIPERDGDPVPRKPSPEKKDKVYEREREVDFERTVDVVRSKTPQPKREMWTEISKDLVSRSAIEYMGYEYEDSPGFFYIMDYLKYDDVLQLTELTEDIRRHREDRVRELEWERDSRRQHHHQHHAHHYHTHPYEQWDEEHVREREIIYENGRPVREIIR